MGWRKVSWKRKSQMKRGAGCCWKFGRGHRSSEWVFRAAGIKVILQKGLDISHISPPKRPKHSKPKGETSSCIPKAIQNPCLMHKWKSVLCKALLQQCCIYSVALNSNHMVCSLINVYSMYLQAVHYPLLLVGRVMWCARKNLRHFGDERKMICLPFLAVFHKLHTGKRQKGKRNIQRQMRIHCLETITYLNKPWLETLPWLPSNPTKESSKERFQPDLFFIAISCPYLVHPVAQVMRTTKEIYHTNAKHIMTSWRSFHLRIPRCF